MVVKIVEFKKIRVKDGIFIEGMPGVGNVAMVAIGNLIEELKPLHFADLLTSHFNSIVLIKPNAEIQILKGSFYYLKAKRDVIIYFGDQQANTPEGTFELINEILKYIKKIGVKEVLTFGGLQVSEIINRPPKIYGAVSEESLKKKYEKYGVIFDETSKRVGSIIGAIGMLAGYAKYYGLYGASFLVESVPTHFVPDHRGAKALLELICKILEIEFDFKKLDKKIREQEELLEKLKMRTTLKEVEEEKEEKKRLEYIQ